MAQIILGGKVVLNLGTDLDPMFTELYAAAGGNFTAATTFTFSNGAGARVMALNGGSAAAEGAALIVRRAGSNSFAIGNAGAVLGVGGADNVLYSYGAFSLRMFTNGTERFTLDSAGNAGIGVVAPTSKLDVFGDAIKIRDAAFSGFVGKGDAVTFGGAASELGFRSVNGDIVFATNNGNIRFRIGAGPITPGADNAQTLGSASFRFSTVYAGTGTINTSDAREKTGVAELTSVELDAARDLAREIGSYRFLEAIAAKGDEARHHVGMTVQRAIEIMEQHGLDPMRYGFICYDEWPEVQTPARVEQREEDTGIVDGEGRPIMRSFEVEVAPANVTPAGDRYSFRPDELLMFIARGFEARLAALEAA